MFFIPSRFFRILQTSSGLFNCIFGRIASEASEIFAKFSVCHLDFQTLNTYSRSGLCIDKKKMEPTLRPSQIHDDWSKIQRAITGLSEKTLDDCVKRLNESLFNKLYKSAKIEESKHDIPIETFDKIMSEIDDEVKTQHIDKQKENKKNQKGQYVGNKRREFISKPVIYIFVSF